MDNFAVKLERLKATFDEEFEAFYLDAYDDPSVLHAACKYALCGQGKRVRPLLVFLTAEIFGLSEQDSLAPALAVEMIHTYSLVHDDLPILDNDDLRRGRYTVHRMFDEATALLVGDALLSDAFFVLSDSGRYKNIDHRMSSQMVHELARSIGGRGMVLGQMLDVDWTGRSGLTPDVVERIERLKTGALLSASVTMGGILGGASAEELSDLRRFGELLGVAFQLIDDLLDGEVGTGKSLFKDQMQKKPSILQVKSLTEAKKIAEKLSDEALLSLASFGKRAESLRFLAKNLLNRKS